MNKNAVKNIKRITAVLIATISSCTYVMADSSVKLGDFSGDGSVNSLDSLMILDTVLKEKEVADDSMRVGDTDRDGLLTSKDAALALSRTLDGKTPYSANDNSANYEYDILVDASLPADKPEENIYTTVKAAYEAASAGTEDNPTVIGLKPDVYILKGDETANGLIVDKPWITLLGLSKYNEDVILADNRGIQQGASNNYNSAVVATGNNAIGFRAENITFYNYCNIDLNYQLDPSKSLKSRGLAETQAFAFCGGDNDKNVFINCDFMSMLDTTSNGAARAYYKDCYIQGTNDFINGGMQVYDGCTIKEFSNHIIGGGSVHMVFMNTEFLTEKNGSDATNFCKGLVPVSLINCVLPDNSQFRWTPNLPNQYKFYYHNVTTKSGQPAVIDGSDSCALELTDEQAEAYNLWNLLRGSDDWDPMNIKDSYADKGNLPLRLDITADISTLITGETGATLTPSIFPSRISTDSYSFDYSSESELVSITPDGIKATVDGNNHTADIQQNIAVETSLTDNGLKQKNIFTVNPAKIDPPVFTAQPAFEYMGSGKIGIAYELDKGIAKYDNSKITWYRCEEADGSDSNPVIIATTHYDTPANEYTFSTGDIGHYLRVSVQPKSEISDISSEIVTITSRQITADDVKTINFYTDFSTTPTHPPLISSETLGSTLEDGTIFRDTLLSSIPDTVPGKWNFIGDWYYNYGVDGAADVIGMITGTRYGRLIYPQVSGEYGDMEATFELYPEKRACQGFGGANQYQEILIKYDPLTQTGLGIRCQRLASDGKAVFYSLYSYKDGIETCLTETPVKSHAFRSKCTLNIKVKGSKLSMTASTDNAEVADLQSTTLEADIETNTYGGIGIYHTGTVSGGNRTLIKSVDVKYNNDVE